MVDPVSVASLFFTSMQFFLELKVYFAERRRKKQELHAQQQQQQHSNQQIFQQYPAHVLVLAPAPAPAPLIITYYTICTTYSIYPAQPPPYKYYHHAPFTMAQFPPHNAYSHDPPLPTQMSGPPLYYHNPAAASSSAPRSIDASLSCSSSSDASLSSIYASTLSYDGRGLLDGHMELHIHQQAPLRDGRYPHGTFGMRTGACAYNNDKCSSDHWKSLKEENTRNIQNSIAVVDWSRGNIDMFVEIGGAFFRNYRVCGCNVAMFAHLFKEREMFSGEIKEQKLKRFNKEMTMVEMRGEGMRSTNSWRSLGIDDEGNDMQEVVREQGSFIRTIRGAVFGLVCGLYEAPSDFNVDMERSTAAGSLDIVRISTHRPLWGIVKRDSCMFSVFSFCDHGWAQGWAAQDVLLG